MVSEMIVKIIAERILNGGLNPKTGSVYVLNDVTNPEYRLAVEDYILKHTEGV